MLVTKPSMVTDPRAFVYFTPKGYPLSKNVLTEAER